MYHFFIENCSPQANVFLWTQITPAMFSQKKYTFAFCFFVPSLLKSQMNGFN